MAASPAQRLLARHLSASLDRAPLSARPLREVVSQLPALLGADQATSFLVRQRRVEFFHGAHMPTGIRSAYENWLRTAPRKFAAYDPERPDPRQRNLVLRSCDLAELTGGVVPAVTRSFLPRFALSESDQMRALICDGPLLLAWVGAFRARPFSRDELRLFSTVVPALQRRLSLEHKLTEAQQRASEIGAALEGVPAAAYVLGRSGGVLHANAAGRALLERERAAIEEQLSTAVRSGAPGVQLARLSSDSELTLAIVQHKADPAPLVAVARARWMLTPRQSQVLHLVAQGMSNRAIAATLGCAEGTVELHVTALLEKSESEGRSHLVARLWSGT